MSISRLILANMLAAACCIACMSTQGAPVVHEVTVDEAVSEVKEGIEMVRQRHRVLPPPRNDAEKLVRIGELDQAPRDAMERLNLAGLDASKRQVIWTAVGELIRPIEEDNRTQVLRLLPPDGWFRISVYGRDAARAAFFVVQHADQALWRRFLPKIEEMVLAGEAEGPAFALMYDRLALSEGRPQRYGSQMTCRDGRYVTMEPVEEMKTIDDRRSAIGMIPYVQYLRIYKDMSC